MAILLPQSTTNTGKLYPLVPIRQGVIFPNTESIIQFGRPKSISAIQTAYDSDKKIVFVSQKDSKLADPETKDLYTVGTLCEIERTLKTNGEMNAYVRGLSRVKLLSVQAEGEYFQTYVTVIEEAKEDGNEIEALVKHITSEFKRAVNLGKAVDIMNFMKLMSGIQPNQLADQVASTIEAKTKEKQAILETVELKDRLKKISELLSHEIKILEIERNIASKTQKKFDKNMRDTVLRERLKTIQKELGDENEEDQEIDELKKKLKDANMPKQVFIKANKELKRLTRMSPHSPETSYIRTWLETLSELPWQSKKNKPVSILKAAEILEEDHYGLEEVKERILEYLAVLKLKGTQLKQTKASKPNRAKTDDDKQETSKSNAIDEPIAQGVKMPTVLCFVGAPGVGKTSIGKSIARSLNRKFVKVSLGGMRDEAEIRGHRRTYVGAMPGRIIQAMQNADSKNPVFMLDEIDKVGSDFRGDPSSALLEVLDPEQNSEFSDHYLEVPYDLSEVMFITTANTLGTIPAALRDRLEIIPFSGYTLLEKRSIAKKHLVQKLLERNGLIASNLSLSDTALDTIISRYTREAGVRSLERQISKLMRKVARKFAEGNSKTIKITPKNIQKFLDPYMYPETFAEEKDEVGMATGLAWTQSGGDILFIEVAIMPGKGKLTLTGQLGSVMKESAEAAFSYIRSKWKELGLAEDFYKDIDIHVHIPEGAIKKDGPSAGITMTTAMVSALTKTATHRDLAMTGEVTLRGRVLEIGGLKEKVIAAHRAGIKTILIPAENEKDLIKIPDEVKKDVKFHFMKTMDQVLELALVKGK